MILSLFGSRVYSKPHRKLEHETRAITVVLGFPILCLQGMGILKVQLFGFNCRAQRSGRRETRLARSTVALIWKRFDR